MSITPTKKYIDINGLGLYHEEAAPEMTYAEWQALPDSKLSDGREYHITDLATSGVKINDSVTTSANVWSALKVHNEIIAGGGGGGITVDDAISSVSENPVQNKVIKTALDAKADLENGKIPASQLPSYVDDVIDGYYKTADGKFYEEAAYITEITGESGKIYISVDTEIQYRWTGSSYSPLGGALALGETSSTAYRGDRGKTAYDDSQTNKAAIGTLSSLTTTAKNNLVAAINELDAGKQDTISAGDGIDITSNEVSVAEMSAEDMSEIITPLPGTMSRRFKYSTVEQIVGEWVNGKPVYQKTITGTTLASGVSGIAHGISNLDDVVNIHGVAHGSVSGTQYIYNFNGGLALDATTFDMLRKFSLAIQSVMSNQIVVYVGSERYAGITSYNITIQYTKTTD